MTDGKTEPMYRKVCVGMLDKYARVDPGNAKQCMMELPDERFTFSHVWLQARCTEFIAASDTRKYASAMLEDGTGSLLALCGDHEALFVPGKYLMVLGRLVKSAAMNNAWVVRPYKVVGLQSKILFHHYCIYL